MKVRGVDYAELLDMVRESPIFPNWLEYQAAGLSAKRYRWDCVWAIPSDARNSWFNKVYQYANDDHIDTALRKITYFAK